MSSPTNSGRLVSHAYEAFRLEPFDAGTDSFGGGKGCSCIFEPFYEDNPEGVGFQYDPSDGREHAEVIIEEAQKEADRIVGEAKKRQAALEQEGYEKGYSQGEKDGKELGARRLDKDLERIHQVLQELLSCCREFRRLYEKETLDLICRIAERVVRGRVDVDHAVVKGAILEAFHLAADRTEVTIKVNPEDIEFVKDLRPQFFDRIAELKAVNMESDPSVSRGGCVMETGFGQVDARIESQLEKITAAVKEIFFTAGDTGGEEAAS